MQHCDPDVLDEVALGGAELSDADRTHLAECPECASSLAALRTVVAVGRDARDVELVEPPASVWAGIAASLGDAPGQTAEVPSLDERRARRSTGFRWIGVAAAACVGLIVGGVVVAAVTRDSTPATPSPTVVATAQLDPLPDNPVDPSASGSAVLKQQAGKDLLVVQTAGLPQPGGFYEVWLMDPKTSGLISIGNVPGGSQQTTIRLPAGVKLNQFSVVDISDEPLDGNPAHSSVSVLRGQLTA
jgi:hypothetical protein